MPRETPKTQHQPWSTDEAAVLHVLACGTTDFQGAANALEILARHDSSLLPQLAPNICVLGDRQPSILHGLVYAGLSEHSLAVLAESLRGVGRVDMASRFSAERYRRQPWRQDWLIDHVRDLNRAGLDARGFLMRAIKSYPLVSEILKARPSKYLELMCNQFQVELPDAPVPFPGSTLFFRNRPEIQAIVQRVEEVLQKRTRARVHVAGDSYGVDSNSLAIALHLRGLTPRVEITASDIDAESLTIATLGSYPSTMMRGVEPSILSLYFRMEDDRYILRPELAASVSRKQFNVAVDTHQPCDVIVFQNALPHMTRIMQKRVLRKLKLGLVPGGAVFLGGFMDPAITQMALDLGFHAVEENCLERYENWQVQRKAWALPNRPYWALPPVGFARRSLYCSGFIKAE